jgi:putative transposase
MDGSIVLSGSRRKRLLRLYRTETDPSVRLRAHLILLLADGHPWALITAVLFCSTATIARWKDRFEEGGVEALREDHRGRPESAAGPLGFWKQSVIGWLTRLTPSFFGLVRSRWCCSALVLVLVETYHVRVSRETVRRWLHREQLVWRRPRPVLGPKDPRRAQKLRKLRRFLKNLPPDEVAVFQDEVDVNTNPKIGCMWMYKGQQAEVVTPGTNVKKYLAGSLNWRTGKLTATPGDKRDAALFCKHLDELRRVYRRYRLIHVVCDNARFHTAAGSKVVRAYLEQWGERVVLHYLPAYSPDTNPIERVWWHLHEEVTRNHRCPGIDSLVDMVFRWLAEKRTFKIEGHVYPRPKAA